MKKYYDKVLFLLGLAVLGIGVGIFYYKGGAPKSSPLPTMKLTGTAFDPIPPPKIDEANADWESPPDQGEDRNESGWTYYVFTPPKIWWQTGEGWTAIPPSGTSVVRPYGIRFVAAKKDLYRVQLEGTAGNGDAKDVIDFSDEESGFDFHLRVGEESPRVQVKVLDMTVDRVEKDHGIIEKVAKVSILDERTNQTISLTQGEPYSPTNNEYYILQITAPYPEQEWKVSKVGDSHDLPNKASFVVTALDFDKPSVTVEKHSFNKKGLEVKPTPKVLTLVDDSAPAPQPTQPGRAGRPASKPAPASSN
jgi:hypothetical protein